MRPLNLHTGGLFYGGCLFFTLFFFFYSTNLTFFLLASPCFTLHESTTCGLFTSPWRTGIPSDITKWTNTMNGILYDIFLVFAPTQASSRPKVTLKKPNVYAATWFSESLGFTAPSNSISIYCAPAADWWMFLMTYSPSGSLGRGTGASSALH